MLLPPQKLKVAAALLLLAPQVPLLFQGEEWGARTPFLYFTDHVDFALGQAVTAGRRREFPHHASIADPQDPATWRKSQLDWSEPAQAAHADLLAWYRRLIGVRRQLHDAPCAVRCDESAGWLALDRGRVFAAFNFGGGAQMVPMPAGTWRRELTSAAERTTTAAVPAQQVHIYFKD